MGKVLVAAKIENVFDIENRERGLLPADQVRGVEVEDALIDTGATTLLLPRRLIAALGSPFPDEAGPGDRGPGPHADVQARSG